MLRRIPATLLVCLVILVSSLFAVTSWAAAPPEQSTEITLRPDYTGSPPPPAGKTSKPRGATQTKRAMGYVQSPVWMYPPSHIMKVQPGLLNAFPLTSDAILPARHMKQWEISGQVLFARLRGKAQLARNSLWTTGWGGWNQEMGFTDFLGLPLHQAVGEFNVRYQFRPNWAFRYSVLGFEMNGAGGTDSYYWSGYGQGMQTKWTHYYHRLGLMYDAVRNHKAKLSVFADWVHTDDRLSLNSPWSGAYYGAQTYSKNGDSAMVGVELQRSLRTFANRATLSLDCKAGGMFLDDVEGWDVQAGARYSIPLNCGRSGYAKGGYRLVEIKKSQSDFLFSHALEGGFLEFGFIF